MPHVREATVTDVDRMVELAAEKRRAYRDHAPVFHRPAADAEERHRPFLEELVEDDDVITLVATDDDGVVGFVIGVLRPPPPVYDPGGPTLLVDDFCVTSSQDWDDVGVELLDEVRRRGRDRGAVQVVVVCGPQDEPKRAMLDDQGLVVASEWWNSPLR